MKDLSKLPDDLPVPVDDGACAHLPGTRIPSVPLTATTGEIVNLGALPGTVVAYVYPMIGRPDSQPLLGWNEIPGARGCTPQSCAFRDHHAELNSLGARVFGVSAQPLEDQKEAKVRLGLPFELLNDSRFALAEAMRLPTFEYVKSVFLKRITIVAMNGIIWKVFYPVFPPHRNAEDVIEWLTKRLTMPAPPVMFDVRAAMEIQSYSSKRAVEIADLYHQSVHAIDPSLYTPEQKEAWAPTPPDYERWSERLNEKRPFMAIIDDRVVGFMELDADGHIDCAYTHPEFQGMGVASALYEHVLAEARSRNINRLYVEASFIAKPFFEHRGFSLVRENRVQRNGRTLVNFVLEKYPGPGL